MPKRKRDDLPPVDFSRFPGFTRLAGTVSLPAQQPAAAAVQELTELTINFVVKTCPASGYAHIGAAQGTFTTRLHRDGTPRLHPDGTPRLRQMCDECSAISRKRNTKCYRAVQDLRRAKRVAYEQATLGEEVDLSGERLFCQQYLTP